jgi:spermidine/putrescine transport system substrate-binding protein
MAMAAGLGGCSVGNTPRGSKAETVDPALVKGFEKLHGVRVRESYFDSMSAMMAKLRAGIAYDVIFPSAEYIQRLLFGNLLRRIDRDRLKHVDTVYPQFTDPWYDAGSEHSTPYACTRRASATGRTRSR